MKKIIVVLVTVLVALSLSMVAAAEEQEQDLQKVKGTVIKIDTAAKSVTIKTRTGDEVAVVMEDASLLSKVTVGGKGQAKYVVKDGKNVGIKLRRLTEGCE